MLLGLWVVVGWMAFVFVFGLVLMGWGLMNGQFDDLQIAAIRMLEDREPEPWPGRENKGV